MILSLGYTRDPPRETLNIYGGSDYAVTSHGGDYTVHVVIGVDPENRMYLLDLWRGQTSSGVRQRPHPRNAPTILNAGLNFIIHWRGDRDNLEDQVIKALASPITNGQPDEKAIIGFTPLRNRRPNT